MKYFFRWTLGGLILIHSAMLQAGTTGRLSISQADLVSPDYHLSEKREFHFISAGLDTLSKVQHESEIPDALQAQARGMIVPGMSVLNYLDVSQLYWKEQFFAVGRKKLPWSRLDEDFKLGIYQPLFKWNPLQYDSQGLTGIFILLEPEATYVPWSLNLFASSLFIPNQGAGYDIKDGKFEKNNPYFSTPPTTAEINGQKTEFNYTIQKPEMSEIINQESYAGRVEVGKQNEGFWFNASYAQKPSNELNLGFQGVLTPGQKIDTQILPKVMYHSVSSAEIRYSFKAASFGFEALRDSPVPSDFLSPWTYAVYSESDMTSAFIRIPWRAHEFTLSNLRTEGGEVQFLGPRAGEAENVLIPRFPFRSAWQAKVRGVFNLKRFQNLAYQSSYLRGEKGEFDLWNSNFVYQFKERWSAYLLTQLVATQPVAYSDRALYHSYADNDLVALGVSYVF